MLVVEIEVNVSLCYLDALQGCMPLKYRLHRVDADSVYECVNTDKAIGDKKQRVRLDVSHVPNGVSQLL